MTAVEGGDFEDGIRLMNRILAVRGQVVPVSPTPLTLHARLADGSVVDGQSQIMRTAGHRAGLAHARRRARLRGRAGGDRRGRAHRARPGQPVHEPAAEPPHPGHPRRGRCARRAPRIFVCNVATQDGETTGFDLAAHVEALAAHTSPDLVDIVLANNHVVRGAEARRASRRRRAGDAGPACAGRRPSSPVPRLVLDDVVDPDNAHHHDPARLAAAIIRALDGETGIRRRHDRPIGRPDRPDVTRSERDLVTALRDELAAIDPSRPCDRVAEVDGLGPGPDRPRGVGRPARRSGSGGSGRGAAPAAAVRLGSRRRPLPGRLAARPVPGPRLAQPGRRPDAPRVRGRARRGAATSRARLAEVGLPVSWRLRRGRGVVTSKNGEAVGTFLRRIGAAGALLELEARQVSRALRGELNRVLNAESANLQRAVSAAGRQLDAIATLDADGRLPAQPYVVRLRRRGAARDARGEPRRARRAARDPSLGGPAGARAARAAGRRRERRRPAGSRAAEPAALA